MILAKKPEDARTELELFDVDTSEAREVQGTLYDLLCDRFPNYVAGRRDRAQFAIERDDYRTAMDDLEFAAKGDATDTKITSMLTRSRSGESAANHVPMIPPRLMPQ